MHFKITIGLEADSITDALAAFRGSVNPEVYDALMSVEDPDGGGIFCVENGANEESLP